MLCCEKCVNCSILFLISTILNCSQHVYVLCSDVCSLTVSWLLGGGVDGGGGGVWFLQSIGV